MQSLVNPNISNVSNLIIAPNTNPSIHSSNNQNFNINSDLNAYPNIHLNNKSSSHPNINLNEVFSFCAKHLLENGQQTKLIPKNVKDWVFDMLKMAELMKTQSVSE